MKRRDFLKLIGVACVAPALPKPAAGCSPVYPAFWGYIPAKLMSRDEIMQQLKDTTGWKHVSAYEGVKVTEGEFGSCRGISFIRT